MLHEGKTRLLPLQDGGERQELRLRLRHDGVSEPLWPVDFVVQLPCTLR